MQLVEIAGLLIVAVHFVAGAVMGERRIAYCRLFLLLAVAAWATEDSCIRAYGLYSYLPVWTLFLDCTPVVVVLTWPVIILSAVTIVRRFAGESKMKRALLTVLVVTLDAAFIEPIAVRAGLWEWRTGGPFGVPVIGILGWGIFAGFCVFFLVERRTGGILRGLSGIALVGISTHALLCLVWWGGMRLIPDSLVDSGIAAVGMWLVALLIVVRMCFSKKAPLLSLPPLLERVPATAFFLTLLYVAADGLELVLYSSACCFAYSAICLRSFANQAFGEREDKQTVDTRVVEEVPAS